MTIPKQSYMPDTIFQVVSFTESRTYTTPEGVVREVPAHWEPTGEYFTDRAAAMEDYQRWDLARLWQIETIDGSPRGIMDITEEVDKEIEEAREAEDWYQREEAGGEEAHEATESNILRMP